MRNPYDIVELDVKTWTLDIEEYRKSFAISNMELRERRDAFDHHKDRAVYELTAHIAKLDSEPLKFPADWKEAVKERFYQTRLFQQMLKAIPALKALTTKYPVRYTSYGATAFFPEMKLSPQSVGRRFVQIQTVRKSR